MCIRDRHHILDRYFKDAVKMVHILPFFLSSGDRGFAPLGYEKVSEEFGNWEDVRMLSEEYPLMFDYMINHISAHSPYYQDFFCLLYTSAASTPGVSYGEKEAIASYIWNLMEKEDRGRPQWYYTKIGTHAYIAKIYSCLLYTSRCV